MQRLAKIADMGVYTNCYNIGLATAKSIEFNWKFDTEKILNEIKKLDKKNTFKFSLRENSLDISFPDGSAATYPLNKKHTFDYILPVRIDGNPLRLTIPTSYLSLLSFLFFLSLESKNYFSFCSKDLSNNTLKDSAAHSLMSDFASDFNLSSFDFIALQLIKT